MYLSTNCVYTFIVCLLIVSASSSESPFLAHDSAVDMLTSRDIGEAVITSSFGLRADIGDGWEEFYSSKKEVRILILNEYLTRHMSLKII